MHYNYWIINTDNILIALFFLFLSLFVLSDSITLHLKLNKKKIHDVFMKHQCPPPGHLRSQGQSHNVDNLAVIWEGLSQGVCIPNVKTVALVRRTDLIHCTPHHTILRYKNQNNKNKFTKRKNNKIRKKSEKIRTILFITYYQLLQPVTQNS